MKEGALKRHNMTLESRTFEGNKGLLGNWILKKKRDKVGDNEKVFCYWTSSAKVIYLCIHSVLIY